MSFVRRTRKGQRCAAVLLVSSLFVAAWAFSLDKNGERLTGDPVVVEDSENCLEAFRVDADGELYHKWQREPGGDWSAWASLGGWLLPDVAVALDADGHLEAFAVDKNSRLLRFKTQTDTNHTWSTWATLGANIMFRPPAVVLPNQDGHLEVFAADAETGVLRHIWQIDRAGNSKRWEGWSSWEALGGQKIEPGFAVGANADGRLEVFGVDPSTRHVVHAYQITANGIRGWSSWNSLKGNVSPKLTVGRNSDGRLELFGVNRASGTLDHIYQSSTSSPSAWSEWSSLGGNFKFGIAVSQGGKGALEIFALNDNTNTMSYCFQTTPGDSKSWSAWENIGGSVRPSPAVARNPGGDLEIFAGDAEHAAYLNYRRQISNGSGWLDWLNMDQPTYQYASRLWTIGEGLPHNEVQAIAQTPDGYLWIGTRGGLARFDGINFTRFDSKNTPEIKSDSITALCVDHEGSLWIGTGDGGAVRLKEGAFTLFCMTNGLASDHVDAICEAVGGSIWIGTSGGLDRFAKGKFTHLTREDGLLSNLIRGVCNDRSGGLWIATDTGLNHWIAAKKEFSAITKGLPDNSVRGLFCDRAGKLWIGTDSGLSLYMDGQFYSYDTHSGLADRVVSAICADRSGNLWVGTFAGLNRFHEGRFINQPNGEGQPYDRINAFFEDGEGDLWVGSKEGLIRLTPKRFFTYTKRQGLTHNNISAVIEDRVRNVWIGTWGGGLEKLRGDVVTPFSEFTHNYILSLCEGYDGVWIGMDFDGGLAKFKNNHFTYFNSQSGLVRGAVKVLHEDRFLNLWIGTSQGLSRFRDGKFRTYTMKDGLAGDDVRAICEDAQGHLWFGTDGGLSCWRNGRFENLAKDLSDTSITALYGDNDRNLWIGTATGGLNRYFDGRVTSYTTKQGLFSDEIFEIVEDDYGWLWMSCSKGIFRVRKTDFDSFDQKRSSSVFSIAYGKADGMQSTQCNPSKPGAWKTSDGKLLFPTTKGLVAVDPKIELLNTPPPVFIEGLLADNHSVMSGGLGARNDEYSRISRRPSLVTVPAGRGELEFHFTALNFQTPEKTRFRYKLDHVDQDWVDAGSRRSAHYNNIYPGNYLFHVIACNSDGVWNTDGASLAFAVSPHYWQSRWFYAIVALAGIGIVYTSARYVTKRRMLRKLESLKQQNAVERERGRIAKDIHDDLGSNLTRIMMLGERIQEERNQSELDVHVNKIVTCARDTMQTLDEIVWAVNPENDTLDGLVAYINQYTSQFFESTHITCRLEMPVEISAIRLSAEVRHDLFLAVKEALNNVLKHAQATEVRVQIREDGDAIKIVIEDNGCGFSANGNGSGRKGHGMENMRRRTENFGGEISIASTPGTGTHLTMSVPLRNGHES